MNVEKIFNYLGLKVLLTDDLKVTKTKFGEHLYGVNKVELLIENDISSAYLRYEKKDLTGLVKIKKSTVLNRGIGWTVNYLNNMYDLELEESDCRVDIDHIKISKDCLIYTGEIELLEDTPAIDIKIDEIDFQKIVIALKRDDRALLYKKLSNTKGLKGMVLVSSVINYSKYSIEEKCINFNVPDVGKIILRS